jgi:CxxC motif-containing protein (DUF1111 family)
MSQEAEMKRLNVTFAVAALIGVMGCGEQGEDVNQEEGAVTGDALPGAPAGFAAAKTNFMAAEGNTDGLGPIMNERSCAFCHQASGINGGAGENIERRYGTLTNGVFNGLGNTGGSLRQLFGIGGYSFQNAAGQTINCQSGTDANPAPGATIFAGRVTTPTFGAGLVELIPDATIQGIAAAQPAAIRGVVTFDTIHLTSGPFTRGTSRVNRFGWKNVHASVADFAADAYLNEMGITTTSCAGGTVVTDFATENRANRAPTNAVIAGCADDAKPGTDDDQAATDNGCAGGVTDVQDDVANFALFMRNLAAPTRRADGSNGRGATVFNSLGCNGCHVTTTFTVTINGRSVSFQPFSDFLKHDMGTLGDGIGNDGDAVAVTRQMRTAPLWGLGVRNHILHDGRTTDRAAAVRAHAGQGAAAAAAFGRATAAQQNDLVLFLMSL